MLLSNPIGANPQVLMSNPATQGILTSNPIGITVSQPVLGSTAAGLTVAQSVLGSNPAGLTVSQPILASNPTGLSVSQPLLVTNSGIQQVVVTHAALAAAAAQNKLTQPTQEVRFTSAFYS